MKRSLNIFISSAASDLDQERVAVSRAVEALKLGALRAEILSSQIDTPAEVCRTMIWGSNVFIGIYGGRYEYIPPGRRISTAEMEFFEARAAHKDILTYIKDDAQREDRQTRFLHEADEFERGRARRRSTRS